MSPDAPLQLFDIVFYLFTAVILISACIVVFSKNIVRAAFSLLFTFFGVAAFYVLLHADFLAVTQLLVYVGGILVLLLFGVMLTNKVIDVEIKTGTMQTLPASILVAVIAGSLCGVFWVTDWVIAPEAAVPASTAPGIGRLLLSNYVLPFEIASIVLLVAMMGAAMIARRERKP